MIKIRPTKGTWSGVPTKLESLQTAPSEEKQNKRNELHLQKEFTKLDHWDHLNNNSYFWELQRMVGFKRT